MKSSIVVLLIALLLIAATPLHAKTLTLGIDLSESNPVVTSPEFAKAVARHAHGEIAALELGDVLQVRHFGERGTDKMRSLSIRMTRQNRPKAVADQVARHIAALPSKTTDPHHQTNILAFLEFGSFDCASGQSRVVIYSDGIEASQTMSDRAFLSGKPLPPPPANYLKGCEVVMFGLGASKDGSLPPAVIESIRQRWTDYFKAADATFTSIIDP